jgi:uncharacterized protein YndB with AHSA1/START domain
VAILKLTQVIARSPGAVFQVLSHGAVFASWNPTIASSRSLTPGPPTEGSQFEWELRGFGAVKQELTEFDPGRRLRIVPDLPSLTGGHRFILTDLDGATRVDHELEMSPRGWFRLMAPVMWITGRRNLRATAEALKRRLESGSPPG